MVTPPPLEIQLAPGFFVQFVGGEGRGRGDRGFAGFGFAFFGGFFARRFGRRCAAGRTGGGGDRSGVGVSGEVAEEEARYECDRNSQADRAERDGCPEFDPQVFLFHRSNLSGSAELPGPRSQNRNISRSPPVRLNLITVYKKLPSWPHGLTAIRPGPGVRRGSILGCPCAPAPRFWLLPPSSSCSPVVAAAGAAVAASGGRRQIEGRRQRRLAALGQRPENTHFAALDQVDPGNLRG